ncbi:MAG: SGNH/GDSL hydrolase N-terminal domain-containing protein, partial [Planctomycetota bacterium]
MRLLTTLGLVLAFVSFGRTADENLDWHDIKSLGLEGQAFADCKAPFDRLPARAEGVVRPGVWGLSRQSAGLCVRFVTDTPAIHAKWTLTSPNLAMPHMPATGVSGLDLYMRSPQSGAWQWLGAGRPSGKENSAVIGSGYASGKHEFLLYLPLYNGVTEVSLGVARGKAVSKGPAYPADRAKPVVFYGTSITQGGCASRPGMVHTAILGRRLGVPVVNLG